MNEVSVNKPMDIAALDQLSRAAASRTADIIDKPRHLRAIDAAVLPTPRQLSADRARRAAQKRPDSALAAASIMLGEYHATFLAAEVLASSVHRNILRPQGSGCCT
jgi:hypothetical protein